MKFIYSRRVSLAGFLLCCFLLGFAAYLQLEAGLLPCPLCVVQRILVLLIGLMFLVGTFYIPGTSAGKKLHSGFLTFFGVAGILVAGRHVWLTMQPAGTAPTCAGTLEYMFKNMAVTQFLKTLLLGTADCAEDTWRMLGLNIPEWTFLFFTALTIFAVIRYKLVKREER